MGDAESKREPIEVGAACTIRRWTDRDPATVIWVAPDESLIVVQEDTATRLDSNGMSEIQDYEYSRDPEGKIHVYAWKTVRGVTGGWGWVPYGNPGGKQRKDHGTMLTIGYRSKYHDYSF